ncbi:hypothetical protein ElyMa_003320300 [Elysia marginata]|uniref:Uncharacterized protein n=1 Tax=Elysia marginata TaxID=1093978 RepID=A0AAV4JEE3_9GAST|nr:hypothetical protein ElyMa_003320300 [Elysia marginata]
MSTIKCILRACRGENECHQQQHAAGDGSNLRSECMQSSVTLFLPVALFALLQCAAPSTAEDERSLQSGAESRSPHSPLALLLRKRSLEAALRAPPSYGYYPESMLEPEVKRGGDEMWIWMPAHGYIPVPNDHGSNSASKEYRTANLMRHG